MALAATSAYVDDATLACPNRATMLLYDGAIAAVRSAIEAIETGDTAARCLAVQQVTDIVTTLHLNLDIKREGEVADGLSKIYGHVLGLLLRVNLYNDTGIAARVIDLLSPLRESWADVDALATSCAWPIESTARVGGKRAANA